MPTPSLLIVPARFKSGKLYSQIPTSGAGDFTVTRATAATRVNASGFIESVASGIPRLDYFASGGTVGCPALLVEPSGSNLLLQSAGFEVSGTWSPTTTTVTTGSTAAFTAPDNSTNADLITATASVPAFVGQNTTIASGTYTISVFAKAGNYGLFRIGNVSSAARAAWFNLDAGVVTGTVNGGTASMQNYGNGWYRCIYTSSGMVSGNTFFAPSDAPNSTNAVSGSSIYFWGAQLETGSVATSYIPTTTGSVTRNADVVSVSGAVSGSIGQTEGTIYAEFSVDFNNRNADILSLNTGNSDNGFFMSVRDTSVVQLIVRTAGANALIFQRVGAFSIGVNKLAMAYKNGDFAICLNGTAVQTNTNNITMPSVSINKIGLGDSALYALDRQLRIRAAALYTTRLTDAQLAALTSP